MRRSRSPEPEPFPSPAAPVAGWASTASTASIAAPPAKRTPSRANRACTTSAASGSSRGRMRGAISSSVTSLPKRAKACASSQPMGPAPITASREGSLVREKTVSFVR